MDMSNIVVDLGPNTQYTTSKRFKNVNFGAVYYRVIIILVSLATWFWRTHKLILRMLLTIASRLILAFHKPKADFNVFRCCVNERSRMLQNA